MPDTTYQPKVYRKQGGDEMVVASGGKLTIESGGLIQFTDSVSGGLWASCPLTGADPARSFQYFEDFIGIPKDDTTNLPTGWNYFVDAGATAIPTQPASAVGGVLQIGTDVHAQDSFAMQLGMTTHEPFCMVHDSGKKLWFGCRVKPTSHAGLALFIGLAEPGSAADSWLADATGALSDKDAVGFRLLNDAPAEWDVAWNKAGGGGSVEIANVAANADDWHTFGFVFDGAGTITFYADGTAISTTATVDHAKFPGGEEMSPIVYLKSIAAAEHDVQVDWIKVVQER